MIVQHKKTKEIYEITVEHWERLKTLKMDGSYKVIDSNDLIAGTTEIKIKDIEILEIKLDKPGSKKVTKTKKDE